MTVGRLHPLLLATLALRTVPVKKGFAEACGRATRAAQLRDTAVLEVSAAAMVADGRMRVGNADPESPRMSRSLTCGRLRAELIPCRKGHKVPQLCACTLPSSTTPILDQSHSE